jgi:hypothetical protein
MIGVAMNERQKPVSRAQVQALNTRDQLNRKN